MNIQVSHEPDIDKAIERQYVEHAFAIHARTDRMFAVLMFIQWAAAVISACVISPFTWNGIDRSIHLHLWLAILGGGFITILPVTLAWKLPGRVVTRQVIAIAQVMFSTLLIHISGGRIETHFHVFGSLAFLAAYRDWRVLLSATVVVAVDHFVRGIWWPESVFGIALGSEWRWIEHAGWVLFEDIFLGFAIAQSVREMKQLAEHTTQLRCTTDRALANESRLLESSEQVRKLSLVASRSRHSVMIANANGDVEWANCGFTKLTGYDIDEIIGKHLGKLLQGPNTNPDTVGRIDERLSQQQSVSEEIVNYSKCGREYWISLEINPVFDDHGGLINFIATQIDISERKERESELERASETALAANRAKSQFLANMSHEIRTPLNAVMGFTDLMILKGNQLSEVDKTEFLQTIKRSGKHLLTLINDILDLSKIESGAILMESEECSPHQLIADVISLMRVRAQEKGISLDYRWLSEVPETIRSDSHRLRQLVLNLVGNAIKFTERGSVMLTACVRQQGEKAELIIEVRDTGIGISKDKFQVIFEPFVQADNSTTRRFGGTGLGLSISRKIAEALQGTLTVESELGKGSTFRAIISAGDLSNVNMFCQPPEHIAGDVKTNRDCGNSLRGAHILVVDDGETNRKLIRLFLERAGATVDVAEHGGIAVDMTRDREYDAILMDMQMPVMDGYAASRHLRDEGLRIPIIALTANAMKGDRAKCEEAGCSEYLTKPIDTDRLCRTVNQCLQDFMQADDAMASQTTRQSNKLKKHIRSTLPTSDPEIRSIVEEFLNTLDSKLLEMETALTEEDFESLAKLAHWLKGAGGTVGFACFTQPSLVLEKNAKQRDHLSSRNSIDNLRDLSGQVIVDSDEPATVA